jgi:hypothetical protein
VATQFDQQYHFDRQTFGIMASTEHAMVDTSPTRHVNFMRSLHSRGNASRNRRVCLVSLGHVNRWEIEFVDRQAVLVFRIVKIRQPPNGVGL